MSLFKNTSAFLSAGALVLTLGMLTPTDAYAQARPTPVKFSEPASVSGPVGFTLQVVHANNSSRIDPKLKSVVDNLKFTRFSGFSLLNQHSKQLQANRAQSFDIVGGRKVTVTLLSKTAKAAKVRVVMTNAKGKVMDTTVSIHKNRAFMIAGPDHDGGKLVMPLTVNY